MLYSVSYACIALILTCVANIGLSCTVTVWNGKIIDVALPIQVTYKIIETAPNFKGNTATGVFKPATLETGAVVNVPMFIESGENIIVSTEGAKYVGRSNA